MKKIELAVSHLYNSFESYQKELANLSHVLSSKEQSYLLRGYSKAIQELEKLLNK